MNERRYEKRQLSAQQEQFRSVVEMAVYQMLLDMEEWTEVEDRLDKHDADVFWGRMMKFFDRIQPIIAYRILRCIPAEPQSEPESEYTGPGPSSSESSSESPGPGPSSE
jgi:hypothetical protein